METEWGTYMHLYRETAFKSYYVVWKLSSAIQSYVTSEKFKSYYVVWKP